MAKKIKDDDLLRYVFYILTVIAVEFALILFIILVLMNSTPSTFS